MLVTVAAPASAQLDETTLAKRAKGKSIFDKFRGSFATTGLNLGTGTFVTGEADNPMFSQDFVLFPRFSLAAGQSVRAYWALECEYTDPDNSVGRHCNPSDVRLSYHHTKLWQDPWLKGRVMGSGMLFLPVSYASRQNHVISNIRLNVGYMVRLFKKLELSYNFGVQKYLQTQKTRGDCPEDLDGDGLAVGDDGIPICLGRGVGDAASAQRSADFEAGSSGSGTPFNDNWLFVNMFHVGYYFTDKLSASVDFAIFNYIRYSTGEAFSSADLVSTGRSDFTMGVVDVSYQLHKNVLVSAGILSQQPALTSDNETVRFPFYDFTSPSNNFTRWYLSGTYVY
jgi:hypothetical protein